MNIRLAKSWEALNKMNPIWKPGFSDNLNRYFFRATVELNIAEITLEYYEQF